MDIQQQDDGKHGVFQALDNDTGKEKLAGEMAYTWAGEGMFIIDHTEVSEDYRGQGIGRQLLDAVVGFAREKILKIIPLCPLCKICIYKEPSIADVLRN